MHSDLLQTFAQLGVAFAGFSSLVGILGQRPARDDPRVNSIRMRAMLLYSVLLVDFALLPLLLEHYDMSRVATWRTLSGVLAVAVGAVVIWLVRRALALLREYRQRRPFIIAAVVPIPTLAAATLLLAANATLAPAGRVVALYLTGLGVLVFMCGFAFSLIVFSFLASPEPAAGSHPPARSD